MRGATSISILAMGLFGLLLVVSSGACADELNPPSQNTPTKAVAPQWSSDWEAGWKRAVKENKPLVLFFKTQGCAYCQRMRKSTYADPQVIEQLDHSFVAVTLSAEQAKKLARRMRIRLFPTTVVIAPENRIVAKLEGFASAEELRIELDSALLRTRTVRKNADSVSK